MRRLPAVSGMVVLMSIVVVSSARGVSTYELTDLGTLAGTNSTATAINASGQVVGWYYTGATLGQVNAYRAFVYSGGVMTSLGVASGTVGSLAYDINDYGVVVGKCYTGSGALGRAFRYSDHTMTNLGVFAGGDDSVASGINNDGLVVGESTGTGKGYGHAFVYRNGQMVDLGAPASSFSYSSAVDINNNGQVAAYGNVPGNTRHVYLQDVNTLAITDLGAPVNGSITDARGMNDLGQIVGQSLLTDLGYERAILYTGEAVIDLGGLPGFPQSQAYEINNHGDIVGTAMQSGSGGISHAMIRTGGQMYDLNALIPDGTGGLTLTVAHDINDSGQIVGVATNAQGQFRAFLLTPTPEPSSLVLLSVGTVGLLAFVWRKRMA